MELSKSDEFKETGPSELCYHIADILAAIAEQGADQFEYTALEVWFSESIGRVRVRVRTGEVDFQYHIDLREPSRCSIRPCTVRQSGGPIHLPISHLFC